MIPDRLVEPLAGTRFQILHTDDSSLTLIDPESGVAFHSGCGAVAETRTVYLQNAGVIDRLTRKQATRVLEIGVGLGLGLLMTVDAAIQNSAPLDYLGVESDLLPAEVLVRLDYGNHLQTPGLFQQWIDWQHQIAKSEASKVVWMPNDAIRVTMHRQELTKSLEQIESKFHAVYFDPFDSATNPDVWTQTVFESLRKLTRPGGRMVTYSVKSEVQRAMTAAGWQVECVPGPAGGKREVAMATNPQDQ